MRKVERRAFFSIWRAAEGGLGFNTAKMWLSEEGVTGVKRASSPYVGHVGLSVPARFAKRAEKILFGRR